MAIHWVFAVVFFATATCASAHSEFQREGQPAPACSHEPSSDDEQPVKHCTECMQVHYLQESTSLSGLILMASLPSSSPASVQPVSFIIPPIFRVAPPGPLASPPPVLRI